MFSKTTKWHLLLPLEELKNWPKSGLKEVSIKGKKLCIAFFHDQYFALKNSCPHANGQLAKGKLSKDGKVICPLHRFEFDCMSGENTSGEGFYAENYPLELRKDGVYIGFKSWRLF